MAEIAAFNHAELTDSTTSHVSCRVAQPQQRPKRRRRVCSPLSSSRERTRFITLNAKGVVTAFFFFVVYTFFSILLLQLVLSPYVGFLKKGSISTVQSNCRGEVSVRENTLYVASSHFLHQTLTVTSTRTYYGKMKEEESNKSLINMEMIGRSRRLSLTNFPVLYLLCTVLFLFC